MRFLWNVCCAACTHLFSPCFDLPQYRRSAASSRNHWMRSDWHWLWYCLKAMIMTLIHVAAIFWRSHCSRESLTATVVPTHDKSHWWLKFLSWYQLLLQDLHRPSFISLRLGYREDLLPLSSFKQRWNQAGEWLLPPLSYWIEPHDTDLSVGFSNFI